MKITDITVSQKKKINLGNYESVDVFASATVAVEDTDPVNEAWELARSQVVRNLAVGVFNALETERSGKGNMPIKGLTQTDVVFPQIGNIRKGAAKTASLPGVDLDFFRIEIDDEDSKQKLTRIYGLKPRLIHVMLPYGSMERNFETWREAYVSGGLTHRCDGEIVMYPPRGERCSNTTCPGKPVGRLRVILPDLKRFAVLVVHTTSVNDIVNLSGQLQAVEKIACYFNRSVEGIPLVLRRVMREISAPTPVGRRRFKKSLLSIEIDPSWVESALSLIAQNALPIGGVGGEGGEGGEVELPPGIVVDPDTGEVPGYDETFDETFDEMLEDGAPVEPNHWSNTYVANSDETLGQRFMRRLQEISDDQNDSDSLLRIILGVDRIAEFAGTAAGAGDRLREYKKTLGL